MTRRSFCMSVAILFCGTSLALAAENKNVLFLTKSQGFQHSVITRDKNDPAKPAHAERLLTEFGAASVCCRKAGSITRPRPRTPAT